MPRSIGLESLAVSVPDRVLTNDRWPEGSPRPVVVAAPETGGAFDREMAPYLKDPFRGAWRRRVLAPGASALELEANAARAALAAAHLGPEDVDLLLCTSLLPDHQGVGGATFLARELEMEGAAWNIESAGSSALVAFQTACSLIAAGRHRRALVVTSCTYSRLADEADPIAWGLGDAATAMIVAPVADGLGYLGGHAVHSAETEGAVAYHVELDGKGELRYRLRAGERALEILRRTAEDYLETCTRRALKKAAVRLEDIDHFVFNTPLAWYAAFCARVLGIDRNLTQSVYPLYADAGPALLGLNLLHAAHWRSFQSGELVLLYSAGDVSSCGAAVVRWGEVALGELPDGASLQELQEIESEHHAGYQLDRLDAEVLAPTRGTAGAKERLRHLVRAYAELAADEPGVMTLFQEGDRVPVSSATRERVDAFVDVVESDISKVLKSQQQVPDLDTAVAALSLMGIVHWGVCQEEAIEQIVYLALHELTKPAEPSPGTAQPTIQVGRKL